MFADVTSANIVGYMNVSRPQQNFCSGSMFNNCGSEGITLDDLEITSVANQAVARMNTIVFMLSGPTVKIDTARQYWYDPVLKCWRKFIQGGQVADDPQLTKEQAKAIKINPGEGVLCNFGYPSAKINYSGEVITGTDKKILISRPQQNFVVTNPSGSTINLNQIEIVSVANQAVARMNTIVFMLTGPTVKIDTARQYWYDPVLKCWRKFIQGGQVADDPQLTKEQAEAITIKPGEGVLCNFGYPSAKISLPTSL